MRIAIVDDLDSESVFIESLVLKWGSENGVKADICRFPSGEAFLDSFKEEYFDIVFMDIYMSGITGAETAKLMRGKDSRTVLIFLTASSEHMREAFSCHAFEYIEKPASYARVSEIMNDVMRIMPGKSQYMEFSCNRQTVRMLYSDFTAAVSSDHYLDITDISGKVYKTRMKFSEFSAPLSGDKRFLQINKGILVNMDFVISIENNLCIMQNNQRLPVKIRDRIQIKEQWLDYNFGKIRIGQRGCYNEYT